MNTLRSISDQVADKLSAEIKVIHDNPKTLKRELWIDGKLVADIPESLCNAKNKEQPWGTYDPALGWFQ